MKTIKGKTVSTVAPAQKRPRGRPTTRTPEISAEIVERLSRGETLLSICRDEHMPPDSTVRNWTLLYPEFAAEVARARELGYDAIAESCLEIVDEPPVCGPDGKIDQGYVQHQKLRAWTRQELLKKWAPKKYGERVAMEHTGADGGPIQTQTIDPGKLSDAVLQELMNARAGTEPG
jgi:hypothetical protein